MTQSLHADHPSLFVRDAVAVITGAASSIGRAAAQRFAKNGMRLVLFDHDEAHLAKTAAELPTQTRIVVGDVSHLGDIERLRDTALNSFGNITVLMNNAAIGGTDSGSWHGMDAWRRVIDVNLWGVINGIHAFTPALLAQSTPSAIINTGSKQGITNPPGAPAYNVAKAGVKILSEQLAHSLRAEHSDVTAHLLVPGWTFTGMSNTQDGQKPQGAWSAEQVVDRMIPAVDAGEFYILCPDNQVSPVLDAARIRWGADDITECRPALSRWHPDWQDRFDAFIARQTK